jgi:hypothetical protein
MARHQHPQHDDRDENVVILPSGWLAMVTQLNLYGNAFAGGGLGETPPGDRPG